VPCLKGRDPNSAPTSSPTSNCGSRPPYLSSLGYLGLTPDVRHGYCIHIHFPGRQEPSQRLPDSLYVAPSLSCTLSPLRPPRLSQTLQEAPRTAETPPTMYVTRHVTRSSLSPSSPPDSHIRRPARSRGATTTLQVLWTLHPPWGTPNNAPGPSGTRVSPNRRPTSSDIAFAPDLDPGRR
jgi:hypothetical protein